MDVMRHFKDTLIRTSLDMGHSKAQRLQTVYFYNSLKEPSQKAIKKKTLEGLYTMSPGDQLFLIAGGCYFISQDIQYRSHLLTEVPSRNRWRRFGIHMGLLQK